MFVENDEIQPGAGGGDGQPVPSGDFERGEDRDDVVEFPDRSREDRERLFGKQPAAAAKPWEFEHNGQKFQSPEALQQYINNLGGGQGREPQPRGQPFDERAVERMLQAQEARYQQMLDQRFAQFNGRGAAPAAPAGGEEKNPYDPDTQPGQYAKWEAQQEFKSGFNPIQQQLRELHEEFRGYRQQIDSERLLSTFDNMFDREAKKLGIDERWRDHVYRQVIADPDVDDKRLSNVTELMSYYWRDIQSNRDKEQEAIRQELEKKGQSFPPAVTKGATPSVMRRGNKLRPNKPVTLSGDTSSFNLLAHRFSGRDEE